jgi:N utilization substance protein A
MVMTRSGVYRLPFYHDRRLSEDAAVELLRTFERMVPAVAEGRVEVVRAVRAPGQRGKLAVRPTRPNVNAVAAAVGEGGSQIRLLEERLGGERVDVVPYSDDIERYVLAALRPGYGGRVAVLSQGEVEVHPLPRDVGAVIGRAGINVALASALCSVRIRVIREEVSATTAVR